MPTLRDPRHEAFAQARAKGALLIDAYEIRRVRAPPGPSQPPRPEGRGGRADRRDSRYANRAEDVSPAGLLASLRRIIKAGENSENPALVNAARLAIVDASRIQAELASQQAHEREASRLGFQ